MLKSGYSVDRKLIQCIADNYWPYLPKYGYFNRRCSSVVRLSLARSIYSLRKTVGKVSLILVTVTSRSDFNLISKVRMSASKKINLMALIRTLTISTTTFERMKKNVDGFRQTV